MVFHFISAQFDLNYLIKTLAFTAIFCVAGIFNKNRLAILIGVALFLLLIIILLFSIYLFPFKEMAALLLIITRIDVYFNAKSLEKELIRAYKVGNDEAYLASSKK